MISYSDYLELVEKTSLATENANLKREVSGLKKQIKNNEEWRWRIGEEKPEILRFPVRIAIPRMIADESVPQFIPMVVEYKLSEVPTISG